MDSGDIPSLDFFISETEKECGFMVTVTKTQTGRYVKKLFLLDGGQVDFDILREDKNIPEICSIPLVRAEDLYTDWMPTNLSRLIVDDIQYKELWNNSKNAIKESMAGNLSKFKNFCSKFNETFDIELTEPKISDEKAYVVNGTNEHNFCIGSGYKSIANIILNSIEGKNSIVLIDEIENHLHPSLLRTLLREIKKFNEDAQIIATTHSPIVINELLNDELIDISKKKLSELSDQSKAKIEKFCHTGRSEMFFDDNIVLVEGITEEMLLRYYLKQHNSNWTVVNVAGIMFEPYIELGCLLNKKMVVVSDNDIALSADLKTPTTRFLNLKNYCDGKGVKILNTYNTLESDLYKNGFIKNANLLSQIESSNIYVARNGKKTLIAEELIESEVDLSSWHIIEEIQNEFSRN